MHSSSSNYPIVQNVFTIFSSDENVICISVIIHDNNLWVKRTFSLILLLFSKCFGIFFKFRNDFIVMYSKFYISKISL